MFYVYVLQSFKDRGFYTGYSHDLKKRIREHNSGEVFSTKYRRPLCLIYFEACLEEGDAKQREKYLKTGRGKNFLKNRLKRYFEKT